MAPLPTLHQESSRLATRGRYAGRRLVERVTFGVLALAIAGTSGYALGVQDVPHCMEDEVYAVQIDTNPNHGLTWACENAYDYSLRMVED